MILARNNRLVVIFEWSQVAIHEFDVEHGILARIKHPHIIGLIGAGRHPRRFVVLENLSGGTLTNVMGKYRVLGAYLRSMPCIIVL
jgi:serine/threonine protein kinase